MTCFFKSRFLRAFSVKRAFSSFFVAAVLLAPPARAGDFTFVHVSDIHVGAGNNVKTDADMLAEISALSPRPAFIAGTGDLCETGTESQYEDYRKIVANLPMPSYQAPGNHDVRWNPLGKEGFVKGSGQPMYQSWSYQGIHFVLLDSTTLLQHWGHFDSDMLAWLKKDLWAWGTSNPVIIGFHHPIGRDNVQADNEQELMDLVAPYNVRLWLQGHGHANLLWNINGTPAVMVQGLYQGAYDIVEIKGDTLRITRRALAQAKKNAGELLAGDNAEAKVNRREILVTTLTKPVAPNWNAKIVNATNVIVDRGTLPNDVEVALRVDQGKYEPLASGGSGWKGKLDAPLAGEHRLTVQATLKDGRAYQLPLDAITTRTGTPKPAWQTNVGSSVLSRLVRDGDTLFVPSMGGDLVAMDPMRGAEKWRVHTAGGVFSTPQVDNGVVYFGSADHNVYAVDLATHQVKWKFPTGGAVFGGASVARGVVCIASCDRTIYGLDAKTGQKKWTVQTGGMTQSKVATDGSLFFVGTWDNMFRAIDAESGHIAWSHKFGKSRGGAFSFYFAPAIGSPTIGDRNVFISSNDGLLHAVDIASGKIAWETPQSHQLGYCGPLYRDGRVYQGSLAGKVYCFDAHDGSILWQADTGGAIYDSSCAFGGGVSRGNVYIGCVDGTFSAIRASDGAIAWQYRLGPGHVLASPTTDEQKVYISSMSGKVTALPLN